MFHKQKVKQLANLLGFKDEKKAIALITRLSGWIKAKNTAPNTILTALTTIIPELHQDETENKKQNIIFPTKNIYIQKYGIKILELHNQGYGVRKISNYLKINHNIKISPTTIHNFIKAQNG